ncbi:uncharacterized protein LOC126838983 isoform X2 [Adelges cooleyi]|uniref:uncharacterized protein LOC126838983 isoform X2 n=1 Tax=Adelges cooleyi TaxID=133065 RepID=UPI00217FF5CF|nr:uncharacterized protein LOC126838983 isoform X2 [Adelges cooleyi]
MLSLRRHRLLFDVSLILCLWATLSQARPADFADPEDDPPETGSAAVPLHVPTVPGRWLTDPNSSFGRTLHRHLSRLPEPELDALETALTAAIAATPALAADHEMMMGDAPASSSSDDRMDAIPEETPTNRTTGDQPQAEQSRPSADDLADAETPQMHRERNKELRLKSIQSQIINFMGWSGRAPPLGSSTKTRPSMPISSSQQRDAIRILYENVKNFPAYPADMYTEKTQSFYPACELPRHTNEEVWNSRDSMNLMFNISLPKASNGITVNVNTAKLRLYKQQAPCSSQANNETDEQNICTPSFLEETIKRSNTNLSEPVIAPLIMEEKQIRVSIYAYTRSLKKKRVKRKLLDSRMMAYFGEKWTEWNIRGAVRTWRRDPSRNFGISIEVEDEEGNLLPVHRFFKPMNCTGDIQMTTPKPIPGFLMEAVQDYSLSNPEANNSVSLSPVQALSFNIQRYPIIDVTTIEVPDSEANNAMQYQHAKYTFEQNLAGMAMQPRIDDYHQHSTDHRIRHNNHHRMDTADYDTSDMRFSSGRDIRDKIIVQGVIHRRPSTELTD